MRSYQKNDLETDGDANIPVLDILTARVYLCRMSGCKTKSAQVCNRSEGLCDLYGRGVCSDLMSAPQKAEFKMFFYTDEPPFAAVRE